MSFNKSHINYIFKTKENDSPSLGKIKKITKEEEMLDNSLISSKEFSIEFEVNNLNNVVDKVTNRIESINSTLQNKLIELRDNIQKCQLNVKEALLGEKKLTGESYTATVPLNKDSITDKTTTTLTDNIVFGYGFNTNIGSTEKIPLDGIYMKGEENTNFTVLNENQIKLEENYYNSYQQIKIIIPTLALNGLLCLVLNKVETINILDSKGYELVSKKITNSIKFPITQKESSFSIRIHSNRPRTLDIKELYITEQVYNTTTTYETLPMNVNENLTYFTVHTCDNYSNKNVNIEYYISINNEEYIPFRPNNKLKNNYIPSIISVNKNNFRATIKLSKPVLDNGLYKFYTEDLVHSYSYNRGFSWKLEEDFNSLEDFLESRKEHFILDKNNNPVKDNTYNENMSVTLFSYIKEDIELVLNNILSITIDDEEVSKNTKGEKYIIKKGVRKIEFKKNMWKEFVDLRKYNIYGVEDDYLVVIDKTTGKKIKTELYYNPREDINTSLYLQLYNKDCELYLREEVLKKKYDNKMVEYFYKEDAYPLYVIGEDLTIEVKTIQIKAILNSIDKVTCPFISNMTIRGI